MALPCFQLLYMTLAVYKMVGHGLINTAHHECLPKKTKVMVYYIPTEGLPKKHSSSVIKVSEQIHSDALKRRPAFSFTVIILA